MCQFGLNVDGTGPNKKPTGILSNSEEILDQVNQVCPGDHQHTPTLHGLPKKAQVYPNRGHRFDE